MLLFAFALLAQVAAPGGGASPSPARTVATPVTTARATVQPVLEFPEAGLDDTAKYRGYRTRFYRDAAGNTLQVYLDQREGRVVHLWADAENESIGLSARDSRDSVATLEWNATAANVARAGRMRTLEYRLVAIGPQLRLGHFLLGTMRVERDFQYWQKHRLPLGAPAFTLDEMSRLLATLGRLEPAEQRRHLAALGARDTATLRRRLHPSITTRATATTWVARVVQPSLDGRDTMMLEIIVDPRQVQGHVGGDSVAISARDGNRVSLTLRVGTTGRALTPLTRREIFTPAFLAALDGAKASANDSVRRQARRLERQARGVELLSSREKLMAGLPTYATYFGRDMLVSAMMMRDIWRPDMASFAVGAALRKLSPSGQVSHEEALGGQAVREAASEYVQLIDARDAAVRAGDRRAADSLGARAYGVLRDSRHTRENYHMVDDELHLPIVAAGWLANAAVPDARKRAFLDDSSDGTGTRVTRLVRELALVARMTEPYARDATAANLIAFAPRDSGRWASTSWRDSGVGYANGKYAMDVNAIWAPHALEATISILAELRRLGYGADALARRAKLDASAPLARWLRDPSTLRAAADTWWGAERHFLVRLAPAEVRAGIDRRLAAMPDVERTWWTRVLATTHAVDDSLTFLALALDEQARPIGVANSDVATRLFLGPRRGSEATPATHTAALRDALLFAREYPAGLWVENVGPVVANDAWASPAVWDMFVRDRYHSPRVAWGREVNLFQLGAARAIQSARGTDEARRLTDALMKVRAAVAASGFGSELWTYEFANGRPVAERYGSGADVQLWSTTDLAVWYALQRLDASTSTPAGR